MTHRCKPSSIAGRARDAEPTTVVVCACGKAWGPSHRGWVQLESVSV